MNTIETSQKKKWEKKMDQLSIKNHLRTTVVLYFTSQKKIKVRLAFEDMWFSLQDCYNRFQSSHVVYPYPLRLGLPYNL
jgi:hypothetical protein